MQQELGRYDTALQMFVEAPRELDMERLRWLRWLNDRGYFWDDARELHAVYPMPRGDK